MICAFFITAQNTIKRSYFYLPFTILSIALIYPLIKSNFDNLLTLGIFPALVALILFTPFQRRAWICISAVLLAELLLAYIELFPLVMVGVGIILIARIWNDLKNAIWYIISAILSLALSALIILPLLPKVVGYYFWQMGFTHREIGSRPGDAGHMTTLASHPIDTLVPLLGWKLLAIALLALFVFLFIGVIGLRKLWREKNYGLVALTVAMLGLFSYLFIYAQYAYGAYKIVLSHWWLISFVLMTGILTITARWKKHSLLIGLGCCWVILNLLGGWYYVHRAQQRFIPSTAQSYYIEPLANTNQIPAILGNKRF
jgi:hypothetical protein